MAWQKKKTKTLLNTIKPTMKTEKLKKSPKNGAKERVHFSKQNEMVIKQYKWNDKNANIFANKKLLDIKNLFIRPRYIVFSIHSVRLALFWA